MMKPPFWILLALLLLLACGSVTPLPLPTFTTIPPTASPVPVNLSKPMVLGSTFSYIDGSTLVAVPAGPFLMGHGNADYFQHTVTLGDFWIYATKVTNAEYAQCVDVSICTPPDPLDDPAFSDFASQNDPVVGVSYDQAAVYCNYVNGTLPTEAQWEKAARGPDGNTYPWGSDDPGCDLLNFNGCVKHTTDVTQYAKGKSFYGALDMEGNTFEWVADWFDPLYYRTSPAEDPAGPEDGKARVQRSSSFESKPEQTPAYTRFSATPGSHGRDLGFRCVVKNPTYFSPFCQLASSAAGQDLSSLSVDCPVISINVVSQTCQIGGAFVTFNDDHPHDPNASFGGVGGCKLISGTPGSYPLQFKCSTASTAVMNSSCTYTGITNTTCPAHYTLDRSTGACNWDRSRTTGIQCPAGFIYDPVAHCCQVASGVGINYPDCPVGTLLIEDTSEHYICLPAASAVTVPPQSEDVNPPDCPATCGLSDEACSQLGEIFCPRTCTCLSTGSKCPTH